MATGNDPALGAESAQVATTSTASDSVDDTSSSTEQDSAPMTTSAS